MADEKKSHLLKVNASTFDNILDKANKAINSNSTVEVPHGGTGLNSIAKNAVVIGSGDSPLGMILSNEGCFYSDGKNQLPKYGVLPIEYGGTGTTNLESLKEQLGLGTGTDLNAPLPIEKGGTGTNNIENNQILIKSNENNKITSIANGEVGQILVSQGPNNPPAYKSPTEITNLGTIKSGTWNGNTIDPYYGGTGATSLRDLKNNLGLGNNEDLTAPLAISVGGTGATDINEARVKLGITPENIGAVKSEGFILNDKVKGGYIVAPITNLGENKLTLTENHNGSFIIVNAASTITLPEGASSYEVEIMRMANEAVTINSSNDESIYTVDGEKTSITIADQYGIVVFKSLGSSWVATGSI